MNITSLFSFVVQKNFNLETIDSKVLQEKDYTANYLEVIFRNNFFQMAE